MATAKKKDLPVSSDPRGLKRICMECGVRFFDLNKRPINCPSCDVEFTGEIKLKARRGRAVIHDDTEGQVDKKKAVANDDDEDEDEEDDGTEIVSLDDLETTEKREDDDDDLKINLDDDDEDDDDDDDLSVDDDLGDLDDLEPDADLDDNDKD